MTAKSTTRTAFQWDLECLSQDSLPLFTVSEMGTAKVCPAFAPFFCVSTAGHPLPSNTRFGYAIPLIRLQISQTSLSAFLSAEAALCTPGLTHFMVIYN